LQYGESVLNKLEIALNRTGEMLYVIDIQNDR
jgi:hypothetical protein